LLKTVKIDETKENGTEPWLLMFTMDFLGGKRMNFWNICLLTASALVLTCGSLESSDKQVLYQFSEPGLLKNLDSVEYKILLIPALLKDESGFRAIWDVLNKTAVQQGIAVEMEDKPFKLSYRNIQYLDTENLELRGRGYTLRYRQKYKKFTGFGNAGSKLGTKYDVTLKYRDSDKAASLASQISVGNQRFAEETKKPELEADVTAGGIIFSHAIKLKLKENRHGTFADLFDSSISGKKGYATMFPELAKLNMLGKAITPVADATIVEAKSEPGKLVFMNNIKPEVAISIFNNTEGEKIVGEVSFDFDIAGKKHTVTFEELKQIEAYYTALRENLGEKISTGTTKTAYVYKLAD